MRCNPAEEDASRIARLKLVIGLFCGWDPGLAVPAANGAWTRPKARPSLAWTFRPPAMPVCRWKPAAGMIEIPIEQVNGCVRGCCDYCTDMTAEFADISVGSARSPEGWDVDRHWNQVIVRTKAGEQLLSPCQGEWHPGVQGGTTGKPGSPSLKSLAMGKRATRPVEPA